MHFFCIFFKSLVICGLFALTFSDTFVPSDAALVCTMFDQFPRSYGRKMQPIHSIFAKKYKKNTLFCIFFQKYLVMSKKSSNFAPAFEKEVRHKVTVLSSSGLGQRPLTP